MKVAWVWILADYELYPPEGRVVGSLADLGFVMTAYCLHEAAKWDEPSYFLDYFSVFDSVLVSSLGNQPFKKRHK